MCLFPILGFPHIRFRELFSIIYPSAPALARPDLLESFPKNLGFRETGNVKCLTAFFVPLHLKGHVGKFIFRQSVKVSMKNILLGALGVLALGTATVFGLLQAGVTDVTADTPHSPVVHRLIEWAREQSIARRVVDIVPPTDLSDAGRIRRGAGNYDAMCVNCHLAPGMEDSEIRKGLYPTPPNLAKPTETADPDRSDARRFWIVKHGLKASGMPAWSKGGMEDGAIWDLTAFLKVMPSLSPEEYHQQIKTSEGHSHGGMEEHGAEHWHDAKTHTHEHGDHHKH